MAGNLCLTQVSVTLKNGISILENISLTLESGRIYGILGPNGAGKSTLLRQMMRLDPRTSGTIVFGGRDISKYKDKEFAKKIAYVPQDTALSTEYTVEEVVVQGRTPYKTLLEGFGKNDYLLAREALTKVDCMHLYERPYAVLSGGEKKRVLMARCLVQESEWLLLDEPSAGVDVKQALNLSRYIRKMHEENQKTIVMTIHDINEAARIATDLILIKDGKVLAQGRTHDCLTIENLNALYETEFIKMQQDHQKDYFVPRDL